MAQKKRSGKRRPARRASVSKLLAAATSMLPMDGVGVSHDFLDRVRLISRDRQASYGDTLTDFTRVAALWSALLGYDIEPEDVGPMMILLKLSRAKQAYHADDMLDVCGYARCHEEVAAP